MASRTAFRDSRRGSCDSVKTVTKLVPMKFQDLGTRNCMRLRLCPHGDDTNNICIPRGTERPREVHSLLWWMKTTKQGFIKGHPLGIAGLTLSQFNSIRKIHGSYFLTKGSPYNLCWTHGRGHFNLGSLNTKFYGQYTVCWHEPTSLVTCRSTVYWLKGATTILSWLKKCWNSELILLTKIITKIRFGLNPLSLVSLYRNGTFENLII